MNQWFHDISPCCAIYNSWIYRNILESYCLHYCIICAIMGWFYVISPCCEINESWMLLEKSCQLLQNMMKLQNQTNYREDKLLMEFLRNDHSLKSIIMSNQLMDFLLLESPLSQFQQNCMTDGISPSRKFSSVQQGRFTRCYRI